VPALLGEPVAKKQNIISLFNGDEHVTLMDGPLVTINISAEPGGVPDRLSPALSDGQAGQAAVAI
jgi:hypothetical protein